MPAWDSVVGAVRREMSRRQVHAARTVVLAPFAQLIPVARAAWTRSAPSQAAFFMPRFESTMNWAARIGGFEPHGDDLRMDAACDALTAASLLDRSGLGAHQGTLAGHLMEAAWSLARPAAAVVPAQRSDWGTRMAAALDALQSAPALELETTLGRIALAWVAHSAYPTDLLFDAQADLLVLVEGLQAEPLHEALRVVWAGRAVSFPLSAPLDDEAPVRHLALHQAQDAEDEAGRAAACVLEHLAHGRSPVALVAQDRLLTRRVRALLGERAVAVRDETGWTLSTTRAAAAVMGLLRAMAWDASTDTVLDWAKNACGLDGAAVAQLESALRRAGTRDWRRVAVAQGVAAQVQAVRVALQSARPLSVWLFCLRTALQDAGQWQSLLEDSAGQAVLDALRLRSGAEQEFAGHSERMGQSVFVAWVSQTLEAGSYLPPHPAQAQVLILPLGQLLGRPLAAVVMPGCDELRLPTSPEPSGPWTPAQRVLLGLPAREQMAATARATWLYALRSPAVDVLWRGSDGGERLMPSALVQELLLQGAALSPDARPLRALLPQPGAMPRPVGKDLPLRSLSASAYEDLRRCPYRFFALRQLRLQEPEELDTELGKRDFGNWLHAVLRHFHEALAQNPVQLLDARLLMINQAAVRATQDLALAQAEFLPFAAAWPRVRVAYLHWLAEHESAGARFVQAEASREMPLGTVRLVGRIDRIDRLADGAPLVIDYKTESRNTTSQRIKKAAEDTQLAFYAALLEDDTLAAMYLHIGETEPPRVYRQTQIVELRDLLLQGIQDDLQRIGAGAGLPALGEGTACDYCAARGLCRKDFWEAGPALADGDTDA